MRTEIHADPSSPLQDILDMLPPGATVTLAPGIYRQKLQIRTPGLTLVGAGADQTQLVYDDYAQKVHPDGREYNTFRTWTLAVCADGVSLRDLSVVNDALSPREKGQEVALSVYGDDFLMEDCVLRSVFDGRSGGFAAAPAHALEQKEGFLFRNCAFTREEAVADGSIFLARPWRDYGLAVFEACSYEAHICPAGFDPWLDSGRDKTARFLESPLRPGRVPWAKAQRES